MMASFGELLDLWWEHKHDIIIVDGLAQVQRWVSDDAITRVTRV